MPSVVSSKLAEDARRVAGAVGRFALGTLVVLLEAGREFQEMPAPCRGCRVEYPRKLLSSIYDIPQYADKPFYRFCPECRQRLRQAYAWAGILEDERRTVVTHLNRAMAAHLPATLTLAEWVTTLNRCNWRCFYCQNAPYEALEHFVPIALGGGTTADNCLPACKRCNSSKGTRHPDDIGESSRSPAAIARARAYLKAQRPPAAVAAESAGVSSVGELPTVGMADSSLSSPSSPLSSSAPVSSYLEGFS